MIIRKNQGLLGTLWRTMSVLAIASLLAGPVSQGLTEDGLIMASIFTPIGTLFALLAWLVRRSCNKKIQIEPDYLLIEDFRPAPLPWTDIVGFSTEQRRIGQRQNTTWLKIHFVDDRQYAKSNWQHQLSRALLGEGIAVCNLAVYSLPEADILAILERHLRQQSAPLPNPDKE
ncbi:hypothetical protein [Balneatrix alpica]|uniref:PH domain-containing protein n=1 Tax=Balneatrix alpica TaxID=75684 RepID=A0ABV5ZA11_9GAMM|nr:hypothetical protein [Balneatrix alpica]